MNFIVYMLQYTNVPAVELLSTEEPPNSYPYQRKAINCFGTTNGLLVNMATHQVCINLVKAEKIDPECEQLPQGVLYDIYFDNMDAWRTQQRDFKYQTTNQFCFPCYDDVVAYPATNNCTFFQSTVYLSVFLRSEIYSSEIIIGTTVIQKVNVSNCFNQTTTFIRISETATTLKLIPYSECDFLFKQCNCTFIDKFDYDAQNKLVYARRFDFNATYWQNEVVGMPGTDIFGTFYTVDLEEPHDLRLMPIQVSDITFNYKCAGIIQDQAQYLKMNTYSSIEQPSTSNDAASIIIENNYFKLQIKSILPEIRNYKFDYLQLRIQFTLVSTGDTINTIDFNLSRFNFQDEYVYCENATNLAINTSNVSSYPKQCEQVLQQLLKLLGQFSGVIYYRFEDKNNDNKFTFATQLVLQFSTGCWFKATYNNNSGALAVQMENAEQSCTFQEAYKSEFIIELFDEEKQSYQELTSTTLYYSTEILDIQFSDCDDSCREKILTQKTRLSVQALQNTDAYIEMWVATTMILKNKGNYESILIIFGVVLILEIIAFTIYYVVYGLITSGRCKKTKTAELRGFNEDEI